MSITTCLNVRSLIRFDLPRLSFVHCQLYFFAFYYEGSILDLIASVPYHRSSFNFSHSCRFIA